MSGGKRIKDQSEYNAIQFWVWVRFYNFGRFYLYYRLPGLKCQSNSFKCGLISIKRFGPGAMSEIDIGTVIENVVVLLNEANAMLKGE